MAERVSGSSLAAIPQLNNLPEEDLSRAFACATAIATHNVNGSTNFQKYVHAISRVRPGHQFHKMHLSSDDEEQQFCLAYAQDAIFIAFRGTKDLVDVACDLMIRSVKSESNERFHKGVYHRSSCFLGLHGSDLLSPLLNEAEGKRIIFCGHSLGGAVAHMVLWLFLLENQTHDMTALEEPAKQTQPLTLVSVAFGAPHFCSRSAANLINKEPKFQWRFMNYVNRRDPVPRLLHNLSATVAEAFKQTAVLFQAEKVLHDLGGFIGDILYFIKTGKCATMGEHSVSNSSDACYNETIQNLRRVSAVDLDEYHPVGSYIFLDYERPDYEYMPVRVIESTSADIPKFLEFVQLGKECLAEHHCESYRQALCKASLIQGLDPYSVHADPDPIFPVCPKPIVSSVSSKLTDDKGLYIKIQGENLLLLRHVQWNKLEIKPQDIIKSRNDLLVLRTRALSTEQHKDFTSERGTLVVRTAFGQHDYPAFKIWSTDYNESEASKLLPKLVQTLMLTINLGRQHNICVCTKDQEDRLMRIIICANNSEQDAKDFISKVRKPDTPGIRDQVNDTARNIARYIESVIELEILPFEIPLGVKLATGAFFLLVARHGDPEDAQDVLAVSAMSWLAIKAANVGNRCLSSLFCDEFEVLLQHLVNESRLWNDMSRKTCLTKKSDLEDELVERVNGAEEKFKGMLRRAVMSTSKDKLRLKMFKKVTEATVQKLLRRIYAIVETKRLYKEIVGDRLFLGILGEEDAGKSTFIKNAMCSRKEHIPEDLPDVSRRRHTSTVTPYELEAGLWLVDFPGSDGTRKYADIWLQFTELPSFIVLLLKFKDLINQGTFCVHLEQFASTIVPDRCDLYDELSVALRTGDVKKPQVGLYETLKSHTPSKILVAFNQVDRELDDDSIDEYKDQYFSGHVKNVVEEFRCKETDVFYVALNPPKDKLKYLNEISDRKILQFEDFFKEVLCRAKSLRGGE